MSYRHFLARRKDLFKIIGEGIAVLQTASQCMRNRGACFPYRFDNYFWYLSGFSEPEAAMILMGGKHPKSILFCREKDKEREIWEGVRYGPKTAVSTFGFDEAYPIGEFEKKLPEFFINREVLWHILGQDKLFDTKIIAALNAVRQQVRAGKHVPTTLHDLRKPLDNMRLIKDNHELSCMRKAAKITSEAHIRVMRFCRPGMYEYALEAELSHEFRCQGASGHAFAPIVAGGKNACTLHYTDNRCRLANNTLVLVDAGCDVEGYAADITRTFPVNGRFTGAQRDIYEIVLDAQKSALSALRPGALFTDYHEAALRVLVQGMIDLRLLAGSVAGIIESGAYKPFYPHQTGHWLGLDVHDAGEYMSNDIWVKLKPGMTLTVEPGLYIRTGRNIPENLHNIGVRLEDNVVITKDGADIYTTAPREINDIEAMMSEKCLVK